MACMARVYVCVFRGVCVRIYIRVRMGFIEKLTCIALRSAAVAAMAAMLAEADGRTEGRWGFKKMLINNTYMYVYACVCVYKVCMRMRAADVCEGKNAKKYTHRDVEDKSTHTHRRKKRSIMK